MERADSATPDKPVQVEYRTYDGLIVRAVGAKRGDDAWVTFTASVDAEQVAQNQAAAKSAQTPASGRGRRGEIRRREIRPERRGRRRRGREARGGCAADPTAEAQQINARVMAWRYKLATFQYEQMTRRMADLLKPAG